jgi:hypothetical protein
MSKSKIKSKSVKAGTTGLLNLNLNPNLNPALRPSLMISGHGPIRDP